MESLLFFGGTSKSYKGRKWHNSNIRTTTDRTPGAIASINFRKYLILQQLDRNDIDSYCIEVLNMDKSRFMNMKTLASVYTFMHKNKILSENDVPDAYARGVFNEENMDQYILPLLPNSNAKQNKIYIRERRSNADIIELERLEDIINFRATFIRYMMVVLKYRSAPPAMSKDEAESILENFQELLLEEQEDAYLDGTIPVETQLSEVIEDEDLF